MTRYLIIIVVLMLALTSANLWLTRGEQQGAGGVSGSLPAAISPHTAPAIGGDFNLIDQNGTAFSNKQLLGKPVLIFFGFTSCPDICPVTLTSITQAFQKMGAKADHITAVFITVDAQTDTPAVIKEYLGNFDGRIIGLTGNAVPLEAVANAYKVYVAKHDMAANEGTHTAHQQIDHSGFLYLMDKNGQYLKHFPYNIAPDTLAEELEKVTK